MADEDHPLQASLEKLDRAKRKFTDLKTEVQTFCDTNLPTIRHEHQFEDGVSTSYFIGKVATPLPVDFVHETTELTLHLRAALDKLAVALVIANGRGPSGVGFPFGGKNNPFPPVRPQAVQEKASADAWTLIVAQKPYPGGNDTLWAVNQIANADKHWAGLLDVRVVPAGNASLSQSWTGSLIFGGDIPTNISFDKKTERLFFRLASPNPVNVQFQAGTQVVFGDIEPVQGKPLLPTLDGLITETDRVLEVFRAQFF